MKLRNVAVGPLSIACHESDSTGPAVVLIHANSLSTRCYERQFDSAMAQSWRLIGIDLPGHGRSSNAVDPSATYSLPGYADVIVEIVRQVDARDAMFVGASLGGHIMLEASRRLPEARGFMMFGTTPVGFPPPIDVAFLPGPAAQLSFKGDLTEVERDTMRRLFFRSSLKDFPAWAAADIERTDPRARACFGESIRPGGYLDEVEIVATMSAPLAILHGHDDRVVNDHYLQSLTMPTLWKHSIQYVPEAGHLLQWEQPDVFNQLLGDFLHDISS